MGAYHVSVLFDPRVVVVHGVSGGSTFEFGAPPITNSADFVSGRTQILAFNAASLASPTGALDLAVVTWRAVASSEASTAVDIEIHTLADTDGVDLITEAAGCNVRVTAGGVVSSTPTRLPATPTPTRTRIPSATVTLLPAAECPGDCDRDEAVTVNEIIHAVAILLGEEPISSCLAGDADRDGQITVNEIVSAVGGALRGCAIPTATPTTFIPRATVTATSSATPVLNLPPMLPAFDVYRGIVGQDIALPLAPIDPEGLGVECAASSLPSGAQLDSSSGFLHWTPSEAGAYHVPITCVDLGSPPATVRAVLAFAIAAPDSCALTSCDPEIGCEVSLPPLQQPCCAGQESEVAGQALLPCPKARMMFVGRNNAGFGRLHNCDRLQVINFLQAGASVRLHVEARCLPIGESLTVQARMATATRVLVEHSGLVSLERSVDGFGRRRVVILPINGPGPFFDLEGAEADLAISLTSRDGTTARAEVRLRLTFDLLDDLPETRDQVSPE